MEHLLLISFPGQGHVNPLLRLAKRLAHKGLLVTFSSTADIGRRIAAASTFDSSLLHVGGPGFPVGQGRLRFDFLDDGDSGNGLDEMLRHLETAGPVALEQLIRRQALEGRPISCVVNNCFMPWAVDVAAAMGIPCAVLWVQACSVFSLYYHVHNSGHRVFDASQVPVVALPGVPELSVADDVPTFLLPSNPYKGLTDTILNQFNSLQKASWVLVNSFEELERDAIAALEGLGVTLIPVGPLIDQDHNADGGSAAGDAARADLLRAADDCVSWLDAHPPHSLIYISLGSIVKLTREDMAEMAAGLTASARPFLWVVRPNCRELLPAGFAEESAASGKGMIVEWCPQERVLAHSATACFLTHCGWNSTLETLSAGVAVVAFPHWGDQVTGAKFLVDVWRIGVRLRSPVQSAALREAMDAVVDGPDAPAMRERAAKWRDAARAAVADGGSSDSNIQAFVEQLLQRRHPAPPSTAINGEAWMHTGVVDAPLSISN